MIGDEAQVFVKRSKYLWWALFFLAYLCVGLTYFFRHDAGDVSGSRLGLIVWQLAWLGGLVLLALVVTLPLLIPRHAGKIVVAQLILFFCYLLLDFQMYIIFLIPYLPLFLLFLLVGVFLPIFLQRRVIIRGQGSAFALVIIFLEGLFIVGGILFGVYITLLLGRTAEASACNQLERVTLWAAPALRSAYKAECPQYLLPTGQTSKAQPYLSISDAELKAAIDQCKVASVFRPRVGFNGVCLRDGSMYVTNQEVLFPSSEPPSYVGYRMPDGQLCTRIGSSSVISEKDALEEMANSCKEIAKAR